MKREPLRKQRHAQQGAKPTNPEEPPGIAFDGERRMITARRVDLGAEPAGGDLEWMEQDSGRPGTPVVGGVDVIGLDIPRTLEGPGESRRGKRPRDRDRR